MAIGHVAREDNSLDQVDPISFGEGEGAKREIGERKEWDFEIEKLYLLSRFLGDRTVGFWRGKKQSCSLLQGQRVGTDFGEFRQTQEGRGFLLLGLFSV